MPRASVPVLSTALLSLAVTPAGHLVLVEALPDDPGLENGLARRLAGASSRGAGALLLHLAGRELGSQLPADASLFRSLASALVSAACALPDLEAQRARLALEPPAGLLTSLLAAAPPIRGGEYLSLDALRRLWDETCAALREVLAASTEPAASSLSALNPAWNAVGRVHLHLAENRRDPERPFAFLATYSSGVSSSGAPQHRPLGEAVRASVSAKDREQLLRLLAPVERAAARSPLLRELVESKRLYQPLGWTPAEAHRFLKEVPALTESGVVVRVPDWWKAARPARPQVQVRIGGKEPSALGGDAILDFDVALTLDGEPLTAAELASLGAGGLTLLRGKWVEIDRAQLDEVLAHWRKAEKAAREGLTFAEGLRLLAGAPVTRLGDDAPEEVRTWSAITAGPWLERALARLSERGDADPGEALQATLRPYQREGVRWLQLLTTLRMGGVLADDMGLGKTIQLLALLLVLKREKTLPGPHLLIVPASLIGNWTLEAARFAPSLRVLVAHGSVQGASAAKRPPEGIDSAELVITTYGSAHRYPWLLARRFGVLVLDEAQAIKSPSARQTKAVKALQASVRFALTGTPVENRIGDLWSIFDFINPGLLGTAREFSTWMKGTANFAPLRALVGPWVLRRLKTDKRVITDLPEKTEVKAYCSLGRTQAALYSEQVQKLAAELKQADGMKRRGVVLASILRLKQICNHPSQALGDGAYDPAQSGKFARLAELAEVIASRQEKVLVFTQFRELAGPLAARLAQLFGRPGLLLSGETPVKERQALVERFQSDERLPFFVLTVKAGGTGLNLTAASHVIHFDRWWNPAVESQATDRAFRIGQRRNVMVHKFVCRGTVEEKIDAMLEEKRAIAEKTLGGEGEEVKLTELSNDELLSLVTLDLRRAQEEG